MTDPTAPTPNAPVLTTTSWHIDRKIFSMGIGGVLSWLILAGLSSWFHIDVGTLLQPYVTLIAGLVGISPAPSAQGFIAIILGGAIGYVTPPSYKDIVSRLNNLVIAQAVADPTNDVTLSGVVKDTATITGETPAAVAKSATPGTGNLY